MQKQTVYVSCAASCHLKSSVLAPARGMVVCQPPVRNALVLFDCVLPVVIVAVGRVSSQLFGRGVAGSVHACCKCGCCWFGWRCRGDRDCGSRWLAHPCYQSAFWHFAILLHSFLPRHSKPRPKYSVILAPDTLPHAKHNELMFQPVDKTSLLFSSVPSPPTTVISNFSSVSTHSSSSFHIPPLSSRPDPLT